MTKPTVESEIEEVQAAYRAKSRDDFMLFLRGLVIPAATGPCMFDECIQPFQVECFEKLAPSLMAVKQGYKPPLSRFWVERTKKAAKDSDLAICILWVIAFAERPILIQVVASHRAQARIIEDRCVDILHYNPWLNDYVEIVTQLIRSRRHPRITRCIIEPTDTASAAQGPAPDILVLNELVHVRKWEVMEAHMNNAAGVPRCLVIISTNAGKKSTTAHKWRKNALANISRWTVRIWKALAPWADKEDVEEARRNDPIGAEFRRLWKGEWISGLGDAVSEELINAAFKEELRETTERLPGWSYLGALDMGISKDHSGLVVIGVNRELRKVRVFWLKEFLPSLPNAEGKLQIDGEAVEECCLWIWKTFGLDSFGYDPAAGGWLIAQNLRRKGVSTFEMHFSNRKNCTAMAQSFVQLMKEGKLECYEDEEGCLRRDIGKFSISYKPPNEYKLEAVSDDQGHADVGTALVITLPKAVEMLGGYGGLQKEDILFDENDEELTEEEVEAMPDDLRDIYEMDEDDYTYNRGRKWDWDDRY